MFVQVKYVPGYTPAETPNKTPNKSLPESETSTTKISSTSARASSPETDQKTTTGTKKVTIVETTPIKEAKQKSYSSSIRSKVYSPGTHHVTKADLKKIKEAESALDLGLMKKSWRTLDPRALDFSATQMQRIVRGFLARRQKSHLLDHIPSIAKVTVIGATGLQKEGLCIKI